MARSGSRTSAVTQACVLTPERAECPTCGQRMWIAYHEHRRVVRLDGVWKLTVRVRRCRNQDCAAYHQAYVPEEVGAWALPQAEFGLDVIALVGQLRYREQRSVPQIHQALRARGVEIAERSVTVLLHRYEELVALRLGDAMRCDCVSAWRRRVASSWRLTACSQMWDMKSSGCCAMCAPVRCCWRAAS